MSEPQKTRVANPYEFVTARGVGALEHATLQRSELPI